MKREILLVSLIVTLVLSCLASLATAEVQQSEVVFELKQSGWVKAKTVKVTVNLTLLTKEENTAKLRKEALTALQDLLKTDWRITSYHRAQDSSGLLRINVVAEARVEEGIIGDIYRKARETSKPELQIIVADISYTPSPDEVQEAMGRLREQAYRRVVEEVKRLDAVTGLKWRIWSIDFTSAKPVPVYREIMKEEAVATPMVASFEKEDRIEIRARVVLRPEQDIQKDRCCCITGNSGKEK
ncbi:MAG: hypothetical protein QW561_00215 [Candidatus Aenigmatarchaeota archaeon]